MKILNLKFKNLNSLYGEWNIDFTHDSYLSDGIFAITGPTGAGKSTILDAICLALYGVTPRLQRISNSVNDIMSRNSGECYSEIIFKTNNGTYLAHWAQHRARKKFDGKLADSTHEISYLEEEKLLSNKKTEVKSLVEKITGMDLERFTRSTLLAQGSFSAFLKASSDDKSKILQQITGTDIYTKISKEVHSRKSGNDQQLKLLEVQIGETVILPKEEESELEIKLKTILKEEESVNNHLASAKDKINIIKIFNTYKRELKDFEARKIQILDESNRLKPVKEKLERAKKAQSIEPLHIKLKERELNYKRYVKELEDIEMNLPEYVEKLGLETSNNKNNEEAYEEVKKRVDKELQVINNVRAMDLHIGEVRRNIDSVDYDQNKLNKRLLIINQGTDTRLKELTALKLELNDKKNGISETLINEDSLKLLPSIRDKVGVIRSNNNRVDYLNKKLESFSKEISDLDKFYTNKSDDLKSQNSIIEDLISKRVKLVELIASILGELSIKEIRREKEYLVKESLYIKKIIKLEDERSLLVKGKPCPLCGSIEHPYSDDGIPEKKEITTKIEDLEQIINRYEEYEESQKLLDKKVEHESCAYTFLEKDILELSLKIKNCNNSVKELKEEVGSILEMNFSLLDEMNSIELFTNEISMNNFEDAILSLEKQVEEWNKNNLIIQELEKRIHGITIEVSGLQQQEELLSKDIVFTNNKQKELKSDLKLKEEERFNIFGGKIPNKEEYLLKKELEEKAESFKNSSETVSKLQIFVQEKKVREDNLKKEINSIQSELKIIEHQFNTELSTLGFKNIDEFKSSKLSKGEILNIEKKVTENESALINIESRISDRKNKLKDLDTMLPKEDLDYFYNKENELDKILKTLREELGGISQKLESNKIAKEKFYEKEKEISRQKAECDSWNKLHSLIGSADGKKFRNFAQGLTFEVMVSHANKQLSKMSDRYLLVRDKDMPLELNVIDNYLGGENRTCRNLSGGESFIISLALALGLSSMSSNKVQVDSLFLDEGFGTLDKDSLDIALNTLSALQQDGKIIGIISHVPTIKERIPTQIEVQPISGGRSRLKGPGCFNS